jgi:autotransporter-associated beta strand protein
MAMSRLTSSTSSTRSRFLGVLFVLALAATLCASPAGAVTYTWDNSNVTGSPAPTLDWFAGGTNPLGLWTGSVVPVSGNANTIQFFADTSTELTNTDTPSVQTSNINSLGAFELGALTLSGLASSTTGANLTMTISGYPLNFSAATGTINLDGLNATQTLTYNLNSDIWLGTAGSAGALTITGNGTGTFNIGGAISELQAGGGSLIKSGTSTVTLPGASTYTGGTTLTSGKLNINSAGVAATNGPLGNGGAFTINGGTIDNTSGSAKVLLNVNPITVGGDFAFSTSAGTASTNLTLPGTVDLGAVTRTITTNGAGVLTLSGIISNTGGGLTKDGTGAMILSGANTYAGATTLTLGTLQGTTSSTSLTPPNPFGTSSLVLNGGTLQLRASGTLNATAETIVLGNNVTVGGNTTIDVNRPGATSTTKTIALGTLGIGAQTLNVTGANSYVLRFGAATTASGAATFNPTSGALSLASLTLDDSVSADTTTTITLGGTNGSSAITGVISNNASDATKKLAIQKSGSSTWTLSGTNTYSGGTTLNGGTLAGLLAGSLGSGPLTVTGNASLTPNYGSYPVLPNSVQVNPGVTLTINNGTQYYGMTFSGALTGSGNIAFGGNNGANSGPSAGFTSSANTFTGTITVSGSGGGGSGASMTVNSLGDGGKYRFNGNKGGTYSYTFRLGAGTASPLVFNTRQIELGNTAANSLSIIENANADANNTITIGTDLSITTAGAKTLQFQGVNTGNNAFNGVIADGTVGAGAVISITKAGTGTWILSGDNSYTGGTTVSGGTLVIGGAGKLGSGSYAGNITIANGATFKYNSSADQTLSGVIGTVNIAGKLVKDGAGALSLSGANIYTGGTTLTSGNLNINSAGTAGTNGPLGNNGAFTINGGTIDNTSGVAIVVANVNPITLGGDFAFSTAAGGAATNLTLPGAITMAADRTVTLNGLGALTLSGLLTNTGDSVRTLTVNNGAGTGPTSLLTIGSYNLTGPGSTGPRVDVINGTGNVIISGEVGNGVSAGSGLTYSGSGVLTLTGANTYTGATTVNGGRLQLNDSAAGTLATSGLAVGAGGTLGFTAGTASTLDLGANAFSLGGTVALDIGASGVNDALTVGDFTLTGNSVFSFNPIGAITSGATYTLLTSTNPIVTNDFSIAGPIGKLILNPTINTYTVTVTPVLLEGIWNKAGGGNWSDGDPGATGGNWTNYKPTVAGDVAFFGSAITSPAIIAVDSAHSVGYLRFDNTNAVTIGAAGSNNLTLDNGASAAVVIVNSGSHIIAENVLLKSSMSVAPASGATLTVSGNLSGAGGVQLTDAGTLVLSGVNSYAGTTTVTAGTLEIGGAGQLGGGTYSGDIAIGAGATFKYNSSANQTLQTGVISGDGSLIKDGAGTLTLSGANTYGGGTTISTGKVIASNNTALGASSPAVSVAGVATLQLNNTLGGDLQLSIANAIIGGGTLEFSASDAATGADRNRTSVGDLSGFTGLISILANGNFSYTNSNATTNQNITIASGGFLSLPSGTANFGALNGAGTITRDKQVDTTATLTVGNGGAGGAFSGSIRGNNVTDPDGLDGRGIIALTKVGAGTQTLSGVNTYTGDTTIGASGGTLEIAGAGQLGSGTYSGNIAIGAGSTFKYNSTADQALQIGVISGDGALVKDNSGTLTLSGANIYTGATVISGGRLQLNGSAAGTPTTSSLTVGTGGTLGFTAGTASTLNLTGKPFSLGGTVALDIGAPGTNDAMTVGDFTLTAPSVFTLNPIGGITNGATYTLLTSANPIVTGGFSITGPAAGRLTLNPTINTYTVTVAPVLDEGIWNQAGGGNWSDDPNWTNYKPAVAGDAALFGSAITGPAVIAVNSAHSVGWLRFDNTNAVTIGATGSSNLTLDNGASAAVVAVNSGSHIIAENVLLTSSVTVAPASGATLRVSGILSGAGGVQLTDAGTLILTGANTYTGNTTLSAGKINLGVAEIANVSGPLGKQPANAAGTIILSGGTLQYSAANTNDYSGRFSTAANQAYNVDTNGQTVTWASNLTSSGGTLTKSGAGALTLSGANTYAGGTVISGGSVINVVANSFGTGPITISGNSALTPAYGVAPTLANSLTVNPGVTVSLLNGNQYQSMTFSSVLAGSGTVVLVTGGGGASGYLTFSSAANTFTGTLQVSTTGNGNPILTVNSLPDSTNPIRLGGSVNYAIFALGAGTATPLVFNNRQIELYGAAGGTINNNNGTATNTITINTDLLVSAAGAKTLTLGGTNTGANTFAGKIADSTSPAAVIGLTKADAGNWILSGVNTYTGATTVSGGTLEIGGAGQLGSGSYAGAIAIAAGKTFKYNSTAAQTLSGVIGTAATAGILVKDGGGTLTLTNANIYTGATTVSAGKLLLGQGGSTMGSMGATAVSVTGGATYGTSYESSGNNIAGGSTLSLAAGTTLDMRDDNTNTMSFTSTGALNGADLYFDLGIAAGIAAGDKLALTGAATVADTNTFYFNVLGGSLKTGTHAYTLISAAGGLDGGTFEIGTTLPEYTLTLDPQDDAVYLNVALSMTPGDTNRDRVVDAADFITLKRNFGRTDALDAQNGNFTTGDTNVNWADLGILMSNMGVSGGAPATTPEPATLCLLAIGALAMLRRRK